MHFQEKLTAALGLLASTGIWRGNYAPPLHRLLWKAGAKTPPPHFLSFAANFLWSGVWFGLVWSLLMWFIVWSREGTSPAAAGASAIFGGVFFGFWMAVYYRYGARKHRIPLWKDFMPDDARI
jgi:hypothetical protein